MNWYYEIDGISQGPLPEADLEARARAGSLAPDGLIWQMELDQWQPAAQLRPDWFKAPAPAPATIVPPAMTEKAQLPGSPVAKVPTAQPATAPMPKTGILARLFGRKK
jgi:GYF domain 2